MGSKAPVKCLWFVVCRLKGFVAWLVSLLHPAKAQFSEQHPRKCGRSVSLANLHRRELTPARFTGLGVPSLWRKVQSLGLPNESLTHPPKP